MYNIGGYISIIFISYLKIFLYYLFITIGYMYNYNFFEINIL